MDTIKSLINSWLLALSPAWRHRGDELVALVKQMASDMEPNELRVIPNSKFYMQKKARGNGFFLKGVN